MFLNINNSSERDRIAKSILGSSKVDPIVILPASERMAVKILRVNHVNASKGILKYLKIKSTNVTLCASGIGSPSVEIIVNGLIAAGAKIILRFDVCGGLDAHQRVGQMFCASEAYSMDGVTLQYSDRRTISANGELLALFTSFCEQEVVINPPVLKGTIATVDFYFAQTKEHHREWRKVAEAVDMETASIYAICSHYSVKAISVMAISDIKTLEQDPLSPHEFDYPAFNKGVESLVNLIGPFVNYIALHNLII